MKQPFNVFNVLLLKSSCFSFRTCSENAASHVRQAGRSVRGLFPFGRSASHGCKTLVSRGKPFRGGIAFHVKQFLFPAQHAAEQDGSPVFLGILRVFRDGAMAVCKAFPVGF